MSQVPSTYTKFKSNYPEIAKAYEGLGERCQDSGPLTARERELVKLKVE